MYQNIKPIDCSQVEWAKIGAFERKMFGRRLQNMKPSLRGRRSILSICKKHKMSKYQINWYCRQLRNK